MVLTDPSGSILSPGYPEGPYENHLNCRWKIEASAGQVGMKAFNKCHNFKVSLLKFFQTIQLSFESFSVESEEACSYDSLTIHNGENENAIVVEKLCGSDRPEDIPSTSSHLYLIFKTDESEGRAGFSLRYEFIGSPGRSPHIVKVFSSCFESNWRKQSSINIFLLIFFQLL